MKVEHIIDNQRIRQTIYSNGSVDTYVRYISIINGVTTFGNWYKVKFNTLGNAIDSNTDLNDITTADEYYVATSTIAATLINCPHTTSGFKLVVEYLNAEIRLRQTIYATNADSDTYVRTYTNAGWGTWKKVSMVTV